MSYPIDQMLALVRANSQFALKLAEIAQTAGQDYAQSAARATAAFVEQFRELKPGTMPVFEGGGISGLFGDLEKSREESLARAKSAFDEWQGSCAGLLTQETGQKEFADAIQFWFQPLLKTVSSEPEKPKAPGRALAKTPETA